jgi:hypothetical protein
MIKYFKFLTKNKELSPLDILANCSFYSVDSNVTITQKSEPSEVEEVKKGLGNCCFLCSGVGSHCKAGATALNNNPSLLRRRFFLTPVMQIKEKKLNKISREIIEVIVKISENEAFLRDEKEVENLMKPLFMLKNNLSKINLKKRLK